MHIFILALFCFVLTYFTTPLFKKLALKFNILDIPNERKLHKEPTPLLGGLSIYISVIFISLFGFNDLRHILGIVIGATLILIVGLIDDIRGLSARWRLIGQFIAAALVISLGVRLSFLPNNLWGNIGEIVLTLIWLIGITNAFNYLDGIDGLSSGIAAISAFFFYIISYQSGQAAIGLSSIILIAGCLGFIPHNFRKAKIFLGEAGSTFLGFMLASLAVVGNWAEDNVVKLTVPVLILGIPIFDMIFTTIMRIKEGKVRSIIEWLEFAGRDHFHHRLIALGLQPTRVLFFIYFINISLGISAMMVSNERAFIGLLSIFQAIIIFGVIAVLMLTSNRRSNGGV